jgi:ferrous iron transport protein B
MNAIRPLRLALVGNPNCGKTALFNRLTGARQKVANYAGVTVERKEGQFLSAAGRAYQVTDLPGAYSLKPMTPPAKCCSAPVPTRPRPTWWCWWWTPPGCG